MLVYSSTPLVDSRVEELVLWTQNLTLLEAQGLGIQTIVLHSSCAKAASGRREGVKGRKRHGKGAHIDQ